MNRLQVLVAWDPPYSEENPQARCLKQQIWLQFNILEVSSAVKVVLSHMQFSAAPNMPLRNMRSITSTLSILLPSRLIMLPLQWTSKLNKSASILVALCQGRARSWPITGLSTCLAVGSKARQILFGDTALLISATARLCLTHQLMRSRPTITCRLMHHNWFSISVLLCRNPQRI